MRQTETTVERQRKPSKWVAIISAALLLLAITASILLGIKMPKSTVIAAPTGDFTSVATIGEEFYAATNSGDIVRMDKNGDVKASINLIQYGTDNNLGVGTRAETVQIEDNSDNVWAMTSGRYLFRLHEKDGKLEVVDYLVLKDGLYGLTEKGNYVYILERDVNFGWLKKFDLTKKFSEGPVSSGHLYTPNQVGQEVTLQHAQNLGILSFEIFDREYVVKENGEDVTKTAEYAYIVHDGGLLRVSTDGSQNKWREIFTEKQAEIRAELYAEKYETLFAEHSEKYLSTKPDAAKEEVDKYADNEANTEITLQANDLAANAIVDEYDEVKAYDGENGKVTLKASAFDKNFYNHYVPKDVTYTGCAYSKAEDKYYMTTESRNMIVCDAAQDFSAYNKRGTFNLEFKHEYLTDANGTKITLPHDPMVSGALKYDRHLNVGYIVYENKQSVSRIDFNTKQLTFTMNLDFDIRSIIQSSDGENIFYLYLNAYEAAPGTFILRNATLNGREIQNTLETLTTLLITFAVCAAIVLLFALLCFYKKGFSEKFIYIMRGFKKQWIIYSIILGTMSLVALFCFYPAIGSISLSFFDYTSARPVRLWNHFENYKYIFTNNGALKEFFNMFIFLGSDLFISLLPPLIFAFFLTIMRNKNYSALTRTLLFIPGIIPGVATTLLWREGIYGMRGVINGLLDFLNGATPNPEINFLGSTENHAMVKWSLIMMGFPFVGSYLIFYGAMMNVPDSYYEAAELDGITVIKRFVFIDVPLILAQIKYVFIMTFIGSVQNFGRTYMTETGGAAGAQTPVHTMYNFVTSDDYGRASAYATVLFIFLFFATMINMRAQTKDNQVA